QYLERLGLASRRQTTVARQVMRYEAQRLEPPMDGVMRAAMLKGMLVMLSGSAHGSAGRAGAPPRNGAGGRGGDIRYGEGGGCMLCEQCKQAPATVHITQIVNDTKREMHLCEDCAGQVAGETGTAWP